MRGELAVIARKRVAAQTRPSSVTFGDSFSPEGRSLFFTYKSYTPVPQSNAGTKARPRQTHTSRTALPPAPRPWPRMNSRRGQGLFVWNLKRARCCGPKPGMGVKTGAKKSMLTARQTHCPNARHLHTTSRAELVEPSARTGKGRLYGSRRSIRHTNPTVEYLANILGKNTILLLSVGIHAPSAFPIGSGNHPFPGGL